MKMKKQLLALLLAAVMVCAHSGSSVEDVIFERRFGCAEGFAAMGARVRVRGRQLSVQPGGVLRGAEVAAPDLRGGAALVVAALAAEGKTRVTRTGCIHRGYAGFDRELASLGAQIVREMR